MRTFFRGNRSRMTLFFASLLFAAISLLGSMALYPQKAYAATDCGWITDKTIRCDDDKNVVTNYVDSNPDDTNRTFKSSKAVTWCKVAGLVNTITIGSSPASATLFEVVTPEPIVGDVGDVVTPDKVPKVDCEVKSTTIALSGVAAAGKATTNCEDRPGGAVQACLDGLADGNAAFARGCSGPYPSSATLCSATAPPEYTKPVDSGNPTKNADNKEPDPCDSLGNDFSLRWIACPLLTAGTGMADALDGLIEENLHYDTSIFDEASAQGKGFKSAWNAFRSIALALVLIAGLIMIISQGTGMQLVDAYTIRKVMPRLLVAVIGITLSWELLAFVITFFNDIGHWIQDLILLPFQSAAGGGDKGNAVGTVAGVLVSGLLGTAGAAAYLIPLGPLGILSLVGTIIMALLIAWIVLVVRSVVITVIILFAPLAFACYILPNTKKVWDFWQNALITMLMVFPIIMALLGAGKAMSLVSSNGIMKILFLIAPYFFIPFAFKLAGGLMATVFSMVNDKGRGGFDRMRNVRANQRKERIEDAVAGRSNNWVAKSGMGNIARRAQLAKNGGFSLTKTGRAEYGEAKRKLFAENAHKAVENDHGRWSNDDSAMGLALQKNMDKGTFLSQYAQSYKAFQEKANPGVVVSDKEANQAALNALGGIQSGLGAELGTDTMRVAAFRAKMASNTAYKAGDWNAIAMDAAPLMADGLMTAADVMGTVKSQAKGRTDFSAVGSSMMLRQLGNVQRDYKANPNATELISEETKQLMLEDGLTGAEPNQIAAARHESVSAYMPAMLKSIKTSYDSNDPEEFMRSIAAANATYQLAGQTSKQKGKIIGDKLMGQAINPNLKNADGTVMNVRQAIETFKGDPMYLKFRAEFMAGGNARAQEESNRRAQAAAQGNAGQPPAPPFNPGG